MFRLYPATLLSFSPSPSPLLPPLLINIPATGDFLYCFISIISPLFPFLASVVPGPVKTPTSERQIRPRPNPRS